MSGESKGEGPEAKDEGEGEAEAESSVETEVELEVEAEAVAEAEAELEGDLHLALRRLGPGPTAGFGVLAPPVSKSSRGKDATSSMLSKLPRYTDSCGLQLEYYCYYCYYFLLPISYFQHPTTSASRWCRTRAVPQGPPPGWA